MTIKQPDDILLFWFSDAIEPLWFNSDLIFDEEVHKLFESTYIAAKEGQLVDWCNQADTILPLILLLDQMPRHMYRGSAEAYATDDQARMHTIHAIKQEFDIGMAAKERMFLYMPLMHSESAEDQEKSVAYYKRLGLETSYEQAQKHKAIIDRFGRFPHRNAALGRESSKEEVQFLQQLESVF